MLNMFLCMLSSHYIGSYPLLPSNFGPWSYSYGEELIFSIAGDLGWPWAPKKHFPFSSAFMYTGFLWDLSAKTVVLPDPKCTRYSLKLAPWVKGALLSRSDCDSIIGTLNHCALVIRDGRSRLPSFYKFAASFALDSPPYLQHRVSAGVVIDAAWWRHRLSSSWCGLNI